MKRLFILSVLVALAIGCGKPQAKEKQTKQKVVQDMNIVKPDDNK